MSSSINSFNKLKATFVGILNFQRSAHLFLCEFIGKRFLENWRAHFFVFPAVSK